MSSNKVAEEDWEAEFFLKRTGRLSGCCSEFSEGFHEFSLRWMMEPRRRRHRWLCVCVCAGQCNRLVVSFLPDLSPAVGGYW